MKSKRRAQYEWARARVREYKDEYLKHKSSLGGFYLEWERFLQDKLETDAVLKRILANFAGVTIARDVWREDDPIRRRSAGETPADDDVEEMATDTLDEDEEPDAAEEEEEVKAVVPVQLSLAFRIGGEAVEATIVFADATVPGGMRKVRNNVCTVGQYLASAELAEHDRDHKIASAGKKRTMANLALDRAGGNRDMLLSDPRIRDPSAELPSPGPERPQPRA